MRWSGFRSACCALAALTAFSAARADGVRWRTKPADDAIGLPARAAPRAASAAETLLALAQQPENRHVVVQFRRPLAPAEREALRRKGVSTQAYLGDNAYFARVEAALDAQAVARLGLMRRAEPIQPINKLHPVLAQGTTPDWVQVGRTDDGDPIVGTYVIFHRDVDLTQQAIPLLNQYGATVRDTLESVNGLVVEAPLSLAYQLATEDVVQWVEAALPRMGPVNDSNRSRTQADQAQAAPFNLDGSGVTVLVYDAGTARSSHQDFGGRLTVHDASGTVDHSTHVAATVGGDGSASGGLYAGMAPGVTIRSYGFEYDGSGTFLYTNPGDIETDYDEAINTLGADIANNSIGTNTEINGFTCTLQGDYGTTSILIDSIVRGSLGAPFRIVWANGNERQLSRCDVEGFGDYYSTPPPSGAKNHIAVGALNSNDDSMTSFSSWGPTDDGRLRPDVSAPGCQSNDDGGVTSASAAADNAYVTFCGTSMAAPTVTGCCALLLQDYRAQFGGPDPLNSTLKALLAHNAVDRGNVGPDYQFGYGSIRVKDTIEFLRTGQFTEDQVAQNSTVEYTVSVPGGTPELKLTLAWDDAPGSPNVKPALINDLDLVAIDPLGGRHFPWTLDPNDPAAAAVQTREDHTNNIEQVLVNSPTSGVWMIRVVGTSVPEGPQTYSLTSSEPLSEAGLRISLPDGVPAQMSPGVGETFVVEIIEVSDTLVAGSPALHFRYNGGPFLTQTLASLGGNQFEATLPPPVCGATPEFYLSAEGDLSGALTSPADAPGGVYSADVGTDVFVVDDDFEADAGWTVTNTDLTDGGWDRGVPAGGGDRADPISDFDGSGQCWLTDNVAGNSDVDGGPTTLTSPAFDLTSLASPLLSVALWFGNDDFDIDTLTVEFSSNNGASWTTAEVLGNTNGWILREYDVSTFVSTQFRVRFSAIDNPNDSVTEAAVDRLRIGERVCSTMLDDCNGNGIEDADDIVSGRSTDTNGNGIPDECDGGGCPDADGDGVCDPNDICPGGDDNVDTDNDGVPDDCDPCPLDNPDDSDADGVCDSDDICPGFDDNADADADGTPDGCDECPDDPNKIAPGDCGCGALETDTDGDGVADCVDPCPLDNPDDSDGDGVCDSDDICPGFDDTVDSDGDGVPDGCDVCPGFDDNVDSDGDGIPDGCETACVGDIDGDLDIDLDDLTLLLQNFGCTGACAADIDGDDDVDLDDLTLLLQNFGAPCA